MVVNTSVIILILLSHAIIIANGGLHQMTYGMTSFYSNFFVMSGGGTVIINGHPYNVNLPVNYSVATLKNITMNLITFNNYLLSNDPVLTIAQKKELDGYKRTLLSMIQSGSFEVQTIAQIETQEVTIYYVSLTKMREDKKALMENLSKDITLLSSPGIPPKLSSTASTLKTELMKAYNLLRRFDYDVNYFYKELYPTDKNLIQRASFVINYQTIFTKLTNIKRLYAYLDEKGMLNGYIRQYWIENFSPTYVKFIRGLYVTPNLTNIQNTLRSYLESLKIKTERNLQKAQEKLNSYTNPPLYQKGGFKSEIRKLELKLNEIDFNNLTNNNSIQNVSLLISIYKKSEHLSSRISRDYAIDIILTILIMGIAIGIGFARFKP